MNEHEMPIKYEAGYPGKDVMRDRAKNIMDEEMKLSGVRKPAPKSMSAPEHENMRYYKKGGHVKRAAGGALPVPKSPFARPMGEPVMKKGGKVKKMAMGGIPGALQNVVKSTRGNVIGAMHRGLNQAPMKKGGKVKESRAKLHREQEHELSDVKKLIHKEGKLKECGGGKVMKMAMGGSGKIRHKEMTAAGKPINKRGSVRMK